MFAIVHGNASKVALDDVLGGDRLSRGTFTNRDRGWGLLSAKGSHICGEGEGLDNADHGSNTSAKIESW